MPNTNTKINLFSIYSKTAEQTQITEEPAPVIKNEETPVVQNVEENNVVADKQQVVQTILPYNSSSLKI